MDMSFASLKDGRLLVGKGKKTFHTAPHPTQPSWYAPDFFLQNDSPWHTHESYEVVDTIELNDVGQTLPEVDLAAPLNEMFSDMQLTKGVVYTSQTIRHFCWKRALSYLILRGRAYYLYGTEGILGATPELLFDLKGDEVETMALAATATNKDHLLRAKEQEEHSIVIEGIEKALSPFGNVTVSASEVIPYGTFFHTKTLITLKATPSFQEMTAALHPTPALGAWPREEGAKWLKKWEDKAPRGRFGAPFGYVFPAIREARAFVAIRCVQWSGKEAQLWAGAGVTKQSVFEEEWEEVLQKLGNIAYLMGFNG